MQAKVKFGNVLNAEDEALCLTIDGAGPGMEGNVARQFALRWPLLWQEITEELRFPVPLGSVFEFEVPDDYDDCQFRVVFLASTLHHQQLLDAQSRNAVVHTALSNILQLLPRYSISSCGTTLMKGGWRMSHDRAILAMNAAINHASVRDTELLLSIYASDPVEFDYLSGMALTLGWY